MLSKRFVIKSGISGIEPDIPPFIDARGQTAVDKLYMEREKRCNEAHPEISKETIERQKTLC
ncbi:hypothetical protein [Ferroplasma acidiphilum]|uniref:hypothetical protein n=1 Tax=Ferroplasma acidiphilum TaxID=74969 RepID=UPI002815EC15|nr:hypothetical protein [Ferroplasma acidiphilum]WMT52310.1 MAG: hypothetical protein RE473_04670 [Ferroplasma acidiphilum]